MIPLSAGALQFLEGAYDESRALFSYSTRLRDGDSLHDFDHPSALRYSVNSLLGLQVASRHLPRVSFLAQLDSIVDRFLATNLAKVDSLADLGLLAVLLSERGDDERLRDIRKRLRSAVDGVDALTLQDVSWILWGLSAVSRAGDRDAEPAARALLTTLHDRFLDSDSLFARHSVVPVRGRIVSFGATAYFFRALHEYASTFEDEYVAQLFRWGVTRTMGVQGRLGEWPWLIDVRSGRAVDLYPVFTVHQDSMAMLFLLPALDDGIPGAQEAVVRSLAWASGRNELSESMLIEEPFFIYRSIERIDRFARPRRFARALARSFAGRSAAPARRERLRVNRECRSYHLGWILYAWSGRRDANELMRVGLGRPFATTA